MNYTSTVSTESHGLENSTACCSKLSAFRFIDYSIGAMAAREDGKKEKKRKGTVIITIQEGDSQESLEEVNNFLFREILLLLILLLFFSLTILPRRS